MKIKDVMVRGVTTLPADTLVKDAVKKLIELKISGLPVVDNDGKLIGMFTEKDILKALLPSYVEKVGKFIYEEESRGIKKKLEAVGASRIKEIMRKEVITVGEDTSCYEAARIMLTQKARRIPVVDKDNRIIGIVARCDILEAITGGI